MMEEQRMTSRRSFLQVGLALSATVASTTAISADAKSQWDETTDVLIFGAGQAGLCAAISAVQSGARNVLVLEKAPWCGGHTAISGSGYYIGGTDIQKAAGIEDSIEINWQDSVARGVKANRFIKRHTDVVRVVYEQGPKDLKWLESLGVKFMPKPVQGIGNRKRVHYVAPGYKKGSPVLIETLLKKAKSLGVAVRNDVALLELVTASGLPTLGDRVIGAVVKTEKGQRKIRARQGVILACGGFANSKTLVERYHPYLASLKSLGSPYNTGDGIVAATKIGANLLIETNGFGMNMLFVGTHRGQSMGLPMTEAPLIVVNKKGERFVDESRGYLAATHMMVEKQFKTANWVFDAQTVEAYRDGCLKPLLETEVVKSYDSIEALAAGEKIDVSQLVKTIQQYNVDVRAGKDRVFGRTKLLQTIDKAPFYAFECGPRIYTSYSGLQIDTKARVLDTTGRPIAGLYAAGDVVGHLAYQCSLGGGGMSGISQATVYGRIAGAMVAGEK